jgi:NAD(P)-dependent dehydrogenase (short-subunit alcohol dehydrogenase family)
VRKPEALEELQARYPQALEVERLDVRDRAAIGRTVDRVLARGPVDIVVNSAGYGAIGAAEELTQDVIDDQLQTLLIAPIATTRAFLPALRERGRGHIIQISSMGGQIAFPGASAYHAAKWGLEGFTESVATEVADFGIRFTLIEPGGVRSGFVKRCTTLPSTRPTAPDRWPSFAASAPVGTMSTPEIRRRSHRQSST